MFKLLLLVLVLLLVVFLSVKWPVLLVFLVQKRFVEGIAMTAGRTHNFTNI